MTSQELLEQIRKSKKFQLMRESFKRRTEINLLLDSVNEDDPESTSADHRSEFYNTLLNNEKLAKQCIRSHQAMREAVDDKTVKYSTGITGLIHLIVPIHLHGETVAYLRAGGFRNSFDGLKKFLDFKRDLREDGFSEELISELEDGFNKLPNLFGEDLADAADWLSERASEIDNALERLDRMHKTQHSEER